MRSPGALTGGDPVELASDVGPAPMHVGALLVLGAGDQDVLPVLVERVAREPRLRQRLVPRDGLRGPRWVDDPGADAADHVTRVAAPA